MVSAPIGLKRGRGSSTTDRKFCSTDRGGACSCSRSAAAATALNDLWNLAAFTTFAALTRAQNRKKTRRPLANRLGELSAKSPIPTNVYASAIGLCRDSRIIQSRKPSNSDF